MVGKFKKPNLAREKTLCKIIFFATFGVPLMFIIFTYFFSHLTQKEKNCFFP